MKESKFKVILYFLEACYVLPITWIIMILPFKFLKPLSIFLGNVTNLTQKKANKIAKENLKVIYNGKLSTKREKEIIKNVHIYNIRTLLEFFQSYKLNKKNYFRFLNMHGIDVLKQIEKQEKPYILATLHLSNWEFFLKSGFFYNLDTMVIIHRQWNPFIDKYIKTIREHFCKCSISYDEVGDTLKIAKHLRKNKFLAIVADETFYFKPLFVPFFGKTAATAGGIAKLHQKFHAPIVIGYSYLDEKGKYQCFINEPLVFEKDASPEQIMTQVNKEYEKIILNHIDQWHTLFHPRWERNSPKDFLIKNLDFIP